MFDVREAQIESATIVNGYRTGIKALDVDCFPRLFDCTLAPLADNTI